MNGIVQAKLLGGFGNQIHQYVAARKYAESIGARLEVPAWAGNAVFGLQDPPYSCELPEVSGGDNGSVFEWGRTNIRLAGYFQNQFWISKLSRTELKIWLHVREAHRGNYVAGHLRVGDYIGHPLFANVPKHAYEIAAAANGDTITHWTQGGPPEFGTLGFVPDFLLLLGARVLYRANSTFSWWAATLGDHEHVYAPLVDDRVGEYVAPFVEGNWPRCAHTSRVGIQVEDLHLPR